MAMLPILLHAQKKGLYDNYDWEKNPTIYTPELIDQQEDVITVFEKHAHEYTYTSNIRRYELLHIRKHLLSDKAIEQENKFYVWTSGSRNILQLKARVIQPSGKIIELNQDNIIESKDEKGKVNYRYFAFEGIEKGSTIEYLHYIWYLGDFDGSGNFSSHQYFDINDETPKKQIELTVHVDKKLGFSAYCNKPHQSLENSSTVVHDTWQLSLVNIAKVPGERYARESKSRHRLFYRVDSQTTNSSYDYLARAISNRYAQPALSVDKEFVQWRDAFLANVFSATDSTSLLKLKAIERALKTQFAFSNEASAVTGKDLLKGQPLSERSFFALMIQLTKHLGIENRIVITCNSRKFLFPDKYQSYLFLDHVMLHFPKEDVYFMAGSDSRIGPAPFLYLDNRALSIRPETVYSTSPLPPLNDIVRIQAPATDYTSDLITTAVLIDPLTLQSTIHLDRSVSGYFAEPYQAGMSSLTEEQLGEVKESFFTYVLTESAQLGEYTFENDNSNAFNDKPLVGHVTATSSSLVSEAGGKLLVNIGTLIGPQSNMYQEKPETRQLPVDLDYLHRYHREIRLAIPAGYKVANTDDLSRSVTPDGKNNSIGFTSSYELLGSELVITIDEWYNELSYPKEQYRYVVDVFNAAADFNALVLVLEKQ
jgi:hypothetical protein